MQTFSHDHFYQELMASNVHGDAQARELVHLWVTHVNDEERSDQTSDAKDNTSLRLEFSYFTYCQAPWSVKVRSSSLVSDVPHCSLQWAVLNTSQNNCVCCSETRVNCLPNGRDWVRENEWQLTVTEDSFRFHFAAICATCLLFSTFTSLC